MRVAIGTHLGPYEIVSPLGAGGMGEVWRARDTRLERSVAIKVLPAEFSTDARLKARFEREHESVVQRGAVRDRVPGRENRRDHQK